MYKYERIPLGTYTNIDFITSSVQVVRTARRLFILYALDSIKKIKKTSGSTNYKRKSISFEELLSTLLFLFSDTTAGDCEIRKK